MHECSIAMGCIYTEAKNYPREPAAHVAISKKSSFVYSSVDYVDATNHGEYLGIAKIKSWILLYE